MDASLKQTLKEAAAAVFTGRPVLAAYAHGSRVSGRPRPESDLDIGHYCLPDRAAQGLSVAEEMSMAAEFSARTGLEVDLRNLDGAPLEIRGTIMEEGVRIYSADDVLRVSLERWTLSFYHDYKDELREMHEVRLRAKAERRGT